MQGVIDLPVVRVRERDVVVVVVGVDDFAVGVLLLVVVDDSGDPSLSPLMYF